MADVHRDTTPGPDSVPSGGVQSSLGNPDSTATPRARAMSMDEVHNKLNAKSLPDYKPTEYLPDTPTARGYHEIEPGLLRAAVLQDEAEYERVNRDSRMPYLLVLPRYEPIAALTTDWDKFMYAFFALFYCHAMLWSVDIRHCDISQSNLMWDPVLEKPKLCDFDLSHFCPLSEVGVAEVGPNGLVRFTNPGTWIFMATDLLTAKAMNGHVKRVYRHEVEAFITVLVWIAYRYVDGRLGGDPPFENWNFRDYQTVEEMRAYTLKKIRLRRMPIPSGPPYSLSDAIASTVSAMSVHQRRAEILQNYIEAAASNPDIPTPTEPLEDWNDLRALRTKFLAWPIFMQLPSAAQFVRLLNKHILIPSYEGQDKKI